MCLAEAQVAYVVWYTVVLTGNHHVQRQDVLAIDGLDDLAQDRAFVFAALNR